jgi:hypothetical protein
LETILTSRNVTSSATYNIGTMRQTYARAAGAAGLLALVTPVTSHSWVEQLMRIAPNGTMVGPPGYPSGYIDRSTPNFNDHLMQNQVPVAGNGPITPQEVFCLPSHQPAAYQPQYPRLVAAPGDFVALRYQENGHVTLPQINKGKPLNSGTVFIYGTTEPKSDDSIFTIHNVWNANGTGGDGRGKLLATRPFDDGQCYQINSNPISVDRQKQFPKKAENPQGENLWCQNDIQLPQDLDANGTYTIYWLWEWNTYDNNNTIATRDNDVLADGYAHVLVNQTYSTCMQIQMTDPCSDDLGSVKAPSCNKGGKAKHSVSFVQGQDLNNAAIKSQLSSNYAIEVQGGNAAGSPDASAASSAASPALSPAPSAPSQSTGPILDIVTVTVTEEVATVYVTATVGITATVTATSIEATVTVTPTKVAGGGGAAKPSSSQGGHPDVQPFQRRSVRRARGEWQLGSR